jgi:hypothetical protein
VVAKRDCNTIFSNELTRKQIIEQLELLLENKQVKLIYITRNKKDVLKSDKGYVPLKRYKACNDQYLKYSNFITATVSYEELLSNPNQVQEYLSSKLNLKVKHLFSEYPSFVPEDGLNEGNYKLRPLGGKY